MDGDIGILWRERLEGAREFFVRYEKRIASAALILGFIVDNIMFAFLNLGTAALILIVYLFITAAGIVLLHVRPPRGALGEALIFTSPFILPLVQFLFGALFSAFTIFYTRSGVIAESWPLLVIIAALLVGNEFFRKRYLRLPFHAAVWFVALLLYAVFLSPILLGSIGAISFILGTTSALIIALGLSLLIYKLARREFMRHKYLLAGSMAGVFIAFQIAYFTNIIPPIPLALRYGEAYLGAERLPSGQYLLEKEDVSLLEDIVPGKTMRIVPGEPVYAFSAIFAPVRLSAPIVHLWEHYDVAQAKWISVSEISFFISGGRREGYRGFTLKNNVEEGSWRVDVATENGQILGRIRFDVEYVEAGVLRKTEIR